MKSPPFLLLPPLLFFSAFTSFFLHSQSKLNTQYYHKTCPQFEQIMEDTVTTKQINNPTTAAGTLRLFFHDCMVEGCDASVLIKSDAFNIAEIDADINLSLPGDSFDLIVRAKTALELACPGIVSCSDILAVATRDLVTMVGGPYFQVRLGRKDGFVSKLSNVAGKIPTAKMDMNEMINLFAAKNFSVQEMVALTGAHTIGFSHCNEFSSRIYNFSKTSEIDPTYYPKFAERLRKACRNYEKNPSMAVFNDVITPGKFDNMYFQNLPRGLGLMSSDHAMILDQRTKPFVELYASNQMAFFDAFARAMEKLSILEIKTGRKGEVRHTCDRFNNIET